MKNGLIINEHGTKRYYLNDKLHGEDGPAVEFVNGTTFWYLNDKRHRVDGPAREYINGDKFWYLNNKRHRVDGPAHEWADGTKHWWLNGKRHRVDGPAEEWSDGDKVWWLNGKELIHPPEFETMEEFLEELNDNEEYSLQWISDINGLIELIKNPTGKQTRLHAMRWKI